MTTQLEFDTAQAGESQNTAILEYLKASVGEWVPMPTLVEVGGGCAVHSRISDLRKLGHQIENQVDRSQKPYRSFYRLTA